MKTPIKNYSIEKISRQGFRKLPGLSGAGGRESLPLWVFYCQNNSTTLKLSELKLQSLVFTYTSWINTVLRWVILFQPEAPTWLVPLLLGYTSDLCVPTLWNPAEGTAASQDDGRGTRRQAQIWKFHISACINFRSEHWLKQIDWES